MKCYYHNADLDGFASAAIVKDKYPEAELIGINYGQQIDYSKILENEIVIMVDFHLEPFTEMVRLAAKVGLDKLTWIDHHITAINEANDCMLKHNDTNNFSFNQICPGIRENGRAACELTWEFLHPDTIMPEAIRLLGRYDVWDLVDPNVLNFQYGMRLNNTDPNNQDMWYYFFDIYPTTDGWIKQTIRDGELILKYQKQENIKYASFAAFEFTFEGFKAIVINRLLTNSQMFESIWDNSKYDIMITFGLMKNGIWNMSFYTDKEGIDVSLLAKKFGGGGHKQAAGCQFSELPVDLIHKTIRMQLASTYSKEL